MIQKNKIITIDFSGYKEVKGKTTTVAERHTVEFNDSSLQDLINLLTKVSDRLNK